MLKSAPVFTTWKPPPHPGDFGPRPSLILRRSLASGAFAERHVHLRRRL